MRTFLLLILAVTTFLLWVKRNETSSPTTPTAAISQAAPPAQAAPSTVSQHDWAKNSLNRTHEVIDQVQKERAGNEQP